VIGSGLFQGFTIDGRIAFHHSQFKRKDIFINNQNLRESFLDEAEATDIKKVEDAT
jgi:hypothetical protein